MVRTAFTVIMISLCAGLIDARAAQNTSIELLDGLDRCRLSFTTGNSDKAFDGWTAVKPFVKSCQTCASGSAVYLSKSNSIQINLTAKESFTNNFGTNFECSAHNSEKLPSTKVFWFQFRLWTALRLNEGLIEKISNSRWQDQTVQVCHKSGYSAAIQIVRYAHGESFSMGSYGGRKWKPKGC